jgi:two-component system sensor histidine kinase UhpB
MPKPYRVLIVEDDLVDRMACRRAFAADPAASFTLIEADNGQQGLALARDAAPDCILLDYHLPDMTGLEFLMCLHDATGPGAPPLMMLTGADSAAVAAEAMRLGARDYLVKDGDGNYLRLLSGAIHRMLREHRLVVDKRQAEAKFRTLVEQIPAITYIANLVPPQALSYISPQIAVLGYSAAEWLADPGLHAARLHPDDSAGALAAIRASRAGGSPLHHEYRLLARDGTARWFRDQAQLVLDEAGQPLCMQGVLIDLTSNKLAEQALQQSQDALRRLAAHQENIKEQERKRIAQEIHDELGGLLTGIKAYISVAIERGAAAAGAAGATGAAGGAAGAPCAPDPLLAEAAALAQDAIATVRRVITDLRPSVLDQLGVWAALEWHASQIAQRSGLAIACSIAPEAAVLDVGVELSTMLFRVAQEALTNVVRHAAAQHVRMEVALAGGMLQMSIADDGHGIDAERLHNNESWGIQGMHERSRHFGGELRIVGVPGQGTTLQLRLPLEKVDGS